MYGDQFGERTEGAASWTFHHRQTGDDSKERNVLVFDLGGGTFDSVLMTQCADGGIVVKNIGGDTHLGGQDWDQRLMTVALEVELTTHHTYIYSMWISSLNCRHLRHAGRMLW